MKLLHIACITILAISALSSCERSVPEDILSELTDPDFVKKMEEGKEIYYKDGGVTSKKVLMVCWPEIDFSNTKLHSLLMKELDEGFYKDTPIEDTQLLVDITYKAFGCGFDYGFNLGYKLMIGEQVLLYEWQVDGKYTNLPDMEQFGYYISD